jgi:ElaB/YqjD/DUF883 family membrane-anchored ribosome-binding protein
MSTPKNLPEAIDDAADLPLAKARAEAARARLAGTLVDLQARLNPKALAREAVGELKEAAQEMARDGLESLKRHPLTLAGAAAAIGLFMARGPLRQFIEGDSDETPEPPASLKPKRARARRKGPSE